ncbi:MFS transporter [Nocardia sp. NPDC088792]|uniref:MFS transporter n=1 Tax=Nocardia sp. NPDC088792 TaxID=3364332 RepID=UPI0037F61496
MTATGEIGNPGPQQNSTPPQRDSATGPQSSTVRGWLGVAAATGGTFVVVTAEMLPVGLLTPMSRALHVSEGAIGLSLTVTGLMAAISAPLLTAWLARFDRRWILTTLMALLSAANLLAAVTPSFAGLLAARVLIGLTMGGVWSLAPGVAMRVAPPARTATAMSLVFSGVAAASVLGVPAGTYLAVALGWRAAFTATAACALLITLAFATLLPRLPAERVTPLRGILTLATTSAVRTPLLVIAFLVTAHFAAYTYIRPVLESTSHATPTTIGTLLLIYGIAGITGNFLSGATSAHSPRHTLIVITTVLAATVLSIPTLATTPLLAAILLILWGLAYGGVSVATQTWLFDAAPTHRESVASLFTAVFNAAIASGALLGGLATDHLTPTAPMWLAPTLTLTALLTAALARPAAR